MTMNLPRLLPLAACLSVLLLGACRQEPPSPVERQAQQQTAPDASNDAGEPPAWAVALGDEVVRIDAAMPGRFGVHVSRFGPQAGSFDGGEGRAWYLSSTIKVPVAIAVLEEVDAGRLTLDEELVLRAEDMVDGAGDMLQHTPGERFSVGTLLEKSLRDSDSTATDMLIRRLGEDHLNARIGAWAGDGFGPVTTIQQVRYDAYGALHPGVADLAPQQIVALRNAEAGEARLQALADALDVPRSELKADTLQDVFDDYYASGRNAATLPAFARMLERLAAGDLLQDDSRALLYRHMQAISTGGRRIQAGLPAGTPFAQKTGTQQQRACNVGILDPGLGRDGATVVVACAEDFGELAAAEQAFQALGRALGGMRTDLAQR